MKIRIMSISRIKFNEVTFISLWDIPFKIRKREEGRKKERSYVAASGLEYI